MSKVEMCKAIREKCIDCMNHSRKEIRLCPIVNCPLYPYRLGTDPDKRDLTPEQKEKLAARFKGKGGSRTKGSSRPAVEPASSSLVSSSSPV